MAREESITSLFNELCRLHLKSESRAVAPLAQPKFSREFCHKYLKRKLYNTFFQTLKDLKSRQKFQEQPIAKEVDAVLCFAFNLRLQRRFDDADRLENLLEKLLQKSKNSPQSDILQVLTFVTKLTDGACDRGKDSARAIGHAERKLPIVYLSKTSQVTLPDGPLSYGDSRNPQYDSQWYMHYPRQIFETECQDLKPVEEKKRSVFELTPGSSLCGHGLFNVKGHLNDEYEKKNAGTLFGALVQSRVTSLEVKLEIPDFVEDGFVPEIRIPKTISSGQLSEDEGFVESKSEICSSTTTLEDSFLDEEDIWEQALNHTLNRHYTWERVGLEAGLTERPYLTEAGAQACDKLWLYKTQQANFLLSETEPVDRTELCQQELVEDILNLMIGVPSTTFLFDPEAESFSFKSGVFVSGFTSEALEAFLSEFLECGTTYRLLEDFSQPLTMNSFYDAGLVFQAFTTAIRKVLQYYRAIVISISSESTLMNLKDMCHGLLHQQQYLWKLCQYKIVVDDSPARFPKGIELISYIYQETLEANSTDHYPLMLSILETTCRPFTLFLQNWVFHGIFQDLYGEFTIQLNHQMLDRRDRQYWTSSYTMTSQNIEDCVPIFLSSMASDIINCGKTLNLLKLCCSDHFMCNIDDKDIPKVAITFSEEDLLTIQATSKTYIHRMHQVARQVSLSRKEQQRRLEQAKHDLMEKAKQVAAKELVRLKGIASDQRRAIDLKKREEFQRLKEQMKEDLHRRATAVEDTKAADKAYMDAFTKREEAMSEEERILEEQAREEVIAYYAELSEEATRREQKALWKIRRARLELKREKFLMDDAEYWAREMVEHRETEKVPSSTDEDLQQWAKDSSQFISTSDVRGFDKINSKGTDDNAVHEDDHRTSFDGELVGPPELAGELKEQHIDSDAISLTNVEIQNFEDEPDMIGEVVNGTGKTVESSEIDTQKVKTPRRTPIKTGLKLSDSMSAGVETEPSAEKYHIQLSEKISASTETTEVLEVKSSVRAVADKHASDETVEDETVRASVRMVGEKHASKESEEVEEKPQIRINPEQHHSKQTEATNERPVRKLMPGESHASDQTEAKEWKIKPKSKFGHASEMSKEPSKLLIPRLKPVPKKHFSFESNFKDYGIKPKIRISKTMSVNKRSDEVDAGPKIRTGVNLDFHPSKQSKYIDHDELRSEIFKERNIHGHASDSSIQRLLYGTTEKKSDGGAFLPHKQLLPADEWPILPVEPLDTDFHFLTDFPNVDLMSSVPTVSLGSLGDYGANLKADIEKYKYMFLPSVLKQSMMSPLKAQISLVNKCVVDYYFVQLKMQEHFEALRRYLLMEDGDFSQILSDNLFEKLATNPQPREMLNPVFLNGVLKKSLESSMQANDKMAENLSFGLKFIPKVFSLTSYNTLDCLELQYKVNWPLNIILTDGCLEKYSLVFSFMMQLKRIVWVLKDVWYRLKRDSLVKKAGNSPQFRQLQLFRQEMQHFVKVMQGYIANQIIHVTWQEFQEALNKDVRDLDDLYKVHGQYLEKAVFRCLLNKKAKPVMKIIQDIFSLIVKFRIQLLSGNWTPAAKSPDSIVHSHFHLVSASYKAFRQYSVFLFEVVNKLAIRGYQPHLQELLLRLNFNNYYNEH